MGKKLFDYVIGNPPYQEQVSDREQKRRQMAQYNMQR